MKKDFFVVIPCLNEVEHIKGICVPLLELSYDVFVADGGSDDGTLAVLAELASRYNSLHLIHNPDKIQSAGINRVARLNSEHYHYMIRIDAHAEYPQDYCQVLLDEIKTNDAKSVVVSLRNKSTSFIQQTICYAQDSLMGNGGSRHRNKVKQGFYTDHGHHAIFDLETFLVLDGYDESFVANEDAEFDLRLVRHGAKIWHTEKTFVYYYPRDSYAKLSRQYYRYGFGRCSTFIKHKSKLKVRQILPVFVSAAFVLAVLSPVSFYFGIPALMLLLLIVFLSVVEAIVKRRSASVLIFIPVLVMNISWGIGFLHRMLKQVRGY